MLPKNPKISGEDPQDSGDLFQGGKNKNPEVFRVLSLLDRDPPIWVQLQRQLRVPGGPKIGGIPKIRGDPEIWGGFGGTWGGLGGGLGRFWGILGHFGSDFGQDLGVILE